MKSYEHQFLINGEKKLFKFQTESFVFSPERLDHGTKIMLSQVNLEKGERLLDLGCGVGVVAVWASAITGDENVFMSDISSQVVTLASANATNNGFRNITAYISDGFANIDLKELDWILSNPPYHTDFSVAKGFIEDGFNRLRIGGKIVMVTKRETWYKNKIISIFGGVKIHREDGYFVFIAEKRSEKFANTVIKGKRY